MNNIKKTKDCPFQAAFYSVKCLISFLEAHARQGV